MGRSNARRRRSHRETRDARDDSRDDRGQPRSARGTVGAVSRAQEAKAKKKTTPLDMKLEDDSCDPLKAPEEERFEYLRKALDEKKRKSEAKGGASAVLAKRVLAAPEGTPKKKRKETEKAKVQKALKILTKKQEPCDSSSSEDFSVEDDEDYLRGDHKDKDLLGKQRRLKKLSSDKPGSLLARGFGLMHEQLGTLHGDKGGTSSQEDMLQPAALRYLLSSALPLMDGGNWEKRSCENLGRWPAHWISLWLARWAWRETCSCNASRAC